MAGLAREYGKGPLLIADIAERERIPRKFLELILLDLKLPKVSGHQVLRAIKSDPRTRAIPVVVLTSSDQDRDLVECYRSGTNSYIQKPVDLQKFQETVRNFGTYWLRVNQSPPLGAFAESDSGAKQ